MVLLGCVGWWRAWGELRLGDGVDGVGSGHGGADACVSIRVDLPGGVGAPSRLLKSRCIERVMGRGGLGRSPESGTFLSSQGEGMRTRRCVGRWVACASLLSLGLPVPSSRCIEPLGKEACWFRAGERAAGVGSLAWLGGGSRDDSSERVWHDVV